MEGTNGGAAEGTQRQLLTHVAQPARNKHDASAHDSSIKRHWSGHAMHIKRAILQSFETGS